MSEDGLIRSVPLFSHLSEADAHELGRMARRITLRPGDSLIEEGAPGDTLYIIVSGKLEVTKRAGGSSVTLATRSAGEYIGEMSLIEQAPRSASVRAVTASEVLEIGPEAFSDLLRRPGAATNLLRTVAERLRSTESSLVQADKLAALGTLAAGLAHELNNPAAAIQRSVSYLAEVHAALRQAGARLARMPVDGDEADRLEALEAEIAGIGNGMPSASSSSAEDALADALQDLGLAEPWDAAAAMAPLGWTADRVRETAAGFRPESRAAVTQWLGAAFTARQMATEIGQASEAISRIVGAVKSYAYLDQVPVQDVDLVRSLEDTLMILNHKLKHGVTVVRDFDPQLPRIEAYAGELNQVWTNLIDNAIQAMGGAGTLTLTTRSLGREVEVRIADTGPGIPETIVGRIFEPFFTTKPQGEGTGLGLHIANNIIVNRHRGRITVETRPGSTSFRIVLPVRMTREQSK